MIDLLRKSLVLFFFVYVANCPAQAIVKESVPYMEGSRAENSGAVSGIGRATHYNPRLLADLPEMVKETSGLVFIHGQLWTMNDSGNPSEIYQIDTLSGKVLRTVLVSNAPNVDWESITADDSNMYIGDFGNNNGNRRNLRILKIRLADLLEASKDTVSAGFIHFSYPDQVSFAASMNANNFDCEAFFVSNDSLQLFSKDWSDLHTRHYVLPLTAGTYRARFVEQFDAAGLVTDASVNAQGNIILLGYKNTGGRSYTCFALLLSAYTGNLVFGGSMRRIELGSALHLGQTEGIVLKNNGTGWISAESIQAGWFYEPAKLFRFDLKKYF